MFQVSNVRDGHEVTFEDLPGCRQGLMNNELLFDFFLVNDECYHPLRLPVQTVSLPVSLSDWSQGEPTTIQALAPSWNGCRA